MSASAPQESVLDAAAKVLAAGAPDEKCAAARRANALWRAGLLRLPTRGAPSTAPDRPARPARPPLTSPGQVKRRRLSSAAGRAALLHAVAHIELNAIDLAFDMVARFGADTSIADTARATFVTYWLTVGWDEARHFCLVAARLKALGLEYGDLPAHDGLWEAAQASAHDIAARLAIAPMVLEARGLDVTPDMIDRLEAAGDSAGAAVLGVIYHDEVGHVAAGARWFTHVCARRGTDPEAEFHRLVRTHFRGALKPPFNSEARTRAGLAPAFYAPLAQA